MCGTVEKTSSSLPNFKVGEKVVLKKDAIDFGTVEESSLFDKILTVVEVDEDIRYDEDYYDIKVRDTNGVEENFKTQQLEYATLFSSVPLGTTVLDSTTGNEATVVGRAVGLIAVDTGDIEWYTQEQFEDIFGEEENSLKEVTLEEVADAFGVGTDKIRIKE